MDAATRRVLEGFKRLFPNYDASKVTQPLSTEILVAACNLVEYAFGAYKDPIVPGFSEQTSHGQRIQHLNFTLANEAVHGVLKIHLKDAKNVADSDYGWGNSSDPYVAFSTGPSCVKSATANEASHPVWNSTHYLVIRKHQLKLKEGGKLLVALFDDDTNEGGSLWSSITNYMNKDDFLGSGEIEIEQLKKPGVQSFDLKLKDVKGSNEDGTVVSFTTEFLSFEAACKEIGVEKGSPQWLCETEATENPLQAWSDLSWIIEFGSLKMDPFAFVDVPSTDTQVWFRVNRPSKTLLVSFRGTEPSKIKDMLLDLTAYRRSFGSTVNDGYVLSATETLTNKDIRVHSGFLNAYESVRESVLQIAYDITGWTEDWSICLTGHSLGGALATLCAFELTHRKSVLYGEEFTASGCVWAAGMKRGQGQ